MRRIVVRQGEPQERYGNSPKEWRKPADEVVLVLVQDTPGAAVRVVEDRDGQFGTVSLYDGEGVVNYTPEDGDRYMEGVLKWLRELSNHDYDIEDSRHSRGSGVKGRVAGG